jgi:hypothetical protein
MTCHATFCLSETSNPEGPILLIAGPACQTSADAARFLAILSAFPIAFDDQTVALAWSDTMHLASAHNRSAYDASYLELAIRLGLALTALDGKLKTGSQAMGVPLFDPEA